ncbi:MAG: hypothetical protein ABIG43_02210 [Chloroflexota bacterium]
MNKSKYLSLLLLLVFILPALACNFPFSAKPTKAVIQQEPTVEGPLESPTTEEVQLEESAPLPQAEAVSEVFTPYISRGVQIMLPDSYVLGDIENDLPILIDALTAMADPEEAANTQSLYDQYEDDIMLWAFDTESQKNSQTSVLVLKNEEFAGLSLLLIKSLTNLFIGEEANTLEQEIIEINGRDTFRTLAQSESAGVITAQAYYVFNDSSKLWIVAFFTTLDELDTRLPDFDHSVGSFQVLSLP